MEVEGGLGSIAIQYAKYIGCDVFATAGNNEKIKLCERLGAKLCINYTKEDFCERVKLETQGKGVDIILDCVGKSYLEKNVDCLSIGGSLIITGTMVFYPMITSKDEVDTMFDIDLRIIDQKKISILGASLLCVPDEVIVNMLAKAVDIVWPLVSKGDIEPVIGKVFNFSEATDALIAMVGFRFPGKVLLVP
ncbi:quinone oxidoreductase pig3 [Phtheirospermum japonicum]|uniref:Quinone oxidoreductase pig3 n=1 Tax=Phtheirospermum japonicum TaxID=374723 RepID=A0A830D9F8_9LAMI|nr:quinone oxidoreductase pig3 [Phtheirospermum japonicum]